MTGQIDARLENQLSDSTDLINLLSQKVVGQSSATKAIVPYVYMYQSGLAPEGRPAGVFLLLGPTGTGKTKTVEAIAELLHGSEKKIVKVDCGEFQMEHEMAKLIGAPPGYLGHRETVPMLTQQQLVEATSEDCDLALVLFDEIEKAAHSMTKLLLGILDKGSLGLGDNSTVNFEKSLIFFTSNLGARELKRTIHRELTQPLATMVARGEIQPGAQVSVALNDDGQHLVIRAGEIRPAVAAPQPRILIVDDNRDLLSFLASQLAEEGWDL